MKFAIKKIDDFKHKSYLSFGVLCFHFLFNGGDSNCWLIVYCCSNYVFGLLIGSCFVMKF